MKLRTKIVAAAAAIALAGALIHLVAGIRGLSIRIPQIDAVVTASARQAPAAAPAAPAVTSASKATRLPAFGENRLTRSVSEPPTAASKQERFEVGPPYWCFRTFYRGTPWMMSTDEKNAGNAARIEMENIHHGKRSLRMDFKSLFDQRKLQRQDPLGQRNVLWQAIRAAPFRGRWVEFRPYLRAMPGGNMVAFLRSWDGLSDAPRLAPDRTDPARTPSVFWGAAWGNPRLQLYVPIDAKFIYYGIVQSGTQPVWIDNVTFDGDPLPGVPSASTYRDSLLEGLPPLPIDPNWVWDKPQNLDFEIIDPDENGEPLPDTPPLPC